MILTHFLWNCRKNQGTSDITGNIHGFCVWFQRTYDILATWYHIFLMLSCHPVRFSSWNLKIQAGRFSSWSLKNSSCFQAETWKFQAVFKLKLENFKLFSSWKLRFSSWNLKFQAGTWNFKVKGSGSDVPRWVTICTSLDSTIYVQAGTSGCQLWKSSSIFEGKSLAPRSRLTASHS